ncbi:hypothetical protein RvY_01754 [Ramazzottius varieornatus]|uniref:GT23 domain-containing protein n=1 Tax=Ramazzottius varieornatus TaxID=947166 RepID=A0A1D1US45_RAMVA|nr:hypothetical protein RvY_01754 [Ramazzottius varieornatus]
MKPAPANPDRNVAVFLHSNGSVTIDKPDALFEFNYVPHSREHDLVYWNLPLLIGWDRYFYVMSVTARAFLTPHPSVLAMIRRIWTELGGSYVFVHIRRGDKARESDLVNITRYTEVLQAKCNGSATVFVMSDGFRSHEEISLALAGDYHIVSYRVLMKRWGLYAAKEESTGHYQEKFDVLPEVQRRALAFELVASMYIGAMADFAVCTYSSNICRLIALFRGGKMNNNGVYSVDWPKWAVVVSNSLINIPDA